MFRNNSFDFVMSMLCVAEIQWQDKICEAFGISWFCYSTKKLAPSQNDTKSTTKTHQCGNNPEWQPKIWRHHWNWLTSLSVHDSTIRKTLNKQGIYSRVSTAGHHEGSHCLLKKNIAACLKFAKEHIDTPQRDWQNVLWTDETKIELFWKKHTALHLA